MKWEKRTIIRANNQEKQLKFNATTFINNLEPEEGREFEVLVRIYKPRRSLEQNRYYWGVVIDYMSRELGYTANECHEILKSELLPKKSVEFKGSVRSVTASTSDLTTKEFGEYIDQCAVILASMEIALPAPLYKGAA